MQYTNNCQLRLTQLVVSNVGATQMASLLVHAFKKHRGRFILNQSSQSILILQLVYAVIYLQMANVCSLINEPKPARHSLTPCKQVD